MSTGPRSRFTIGNLMLAVAGVALTMGVFMTPGFARVLIGMVILLSILVLGSYLAARRLLEMTYGQQCPGCGRRGLERKAVLSFGERFFSCPHCGLRCRRNAVGGYGPSFWKDASGPEFDALYRKPEEGDPWNAPPGLEDEDVVYSKTHLNLVRNKRRRNPDSPNGPGLE